MLETSFFEQEVAAHNPITELDKRMTRWIVFAGDATTPRFKRTFDGMQLGGEYLGGNYKSLVYTRGLLRRCQITPMTVGYDYLNDQSLGDEKSRYKSTTVLAYTHDDPSNPDKRRQITRFYNECLPGDELQGLMQSFQGAKDVGIREIESLRGIDPPTKDNPDCPAVRYQYEIFPDWDKYLLPAGHKEHQPFFATTEALSDYLRDRKAFVSAAARECIEVMLESNAQFERWATAKLDEMGRLVKAPPVDGKVYSWEQIHHQHFDYLNLSKEEFLTKRSDAPQGATSEVSREEFNEMKSALSEITGILKPLAQAAVASVGVAETVSIETLPEPKTEAPACADFNAHRQPCKAKVSKEIDGVLYCANHPKADGNN